MRVLIHTQKGGTDSITSTANAAHKYRNVGMTSDSNEMRQLSPWKLMASVIDNSVNVYNYVPLIALIISSHVDTDG